MQPGLSGRSLPSSPPIIKPSVPVGIPPSPPAAPTAVLRNRIAFESVPLPGICRSFSGKKQLVTLVTPGIAKHCREFMANHREYAAANAYAYVCHTAPHWPEHAASFSKVWYVHAAMLDSDTEVVIWADADVAFIDMTVDLAALLAPGYWLAGYVLKNRRDRSHPRICGGLLVTLNVPHAREFFAAVLRSEPRWHGDNLVNKHHPWEEYYIDEELAARNFAGVRLCDTAMIGGFSRESWNDGSPWFPGCPTVHVARGGWAQRQHILRNKYLPQVNR